MTHSQGQDSRFPTINQAMVTSLAKAIDYFGVGKRHCRVRHWLKFQTLFGFDTDALAIQLHCLLNHQFQIEC
jgi:hypothetical protein